MSENERQPQPDHVAAMDQARAGTADVASIVASYFHGLMANGVPIEAAVQLANGYQGIIAMIGMQQSDD